MWLWFLVIGRVVVVHGRAVKFFCFPLEKGVCGGRGMGLVAGCVVSSQ